MATFDQKGGLGDKLGQHPAADIPAELGWEQMGPKIQAALAAKKRRRLLWWWFPSAVLALAAVAYFALAAEQEDIGSLPIPAATAHARPATDAAARPAAQSEAQSKPKPEPRIESKRSAGPQSPMATAKLRPLIAKRLPAPVIAEKLPSGTVEAIRAQGLAPQATLAEATVPNADLQDHSQAAWQPLPLIEPLLAAPLPSPGTAEWAAAKPIDPARQPSVWMLELDAGRSFNLSPMGSSPDFPNTDVAALSGFSGGVRVGYALRNTPYAIWTGAMVEEFVQRERLSDAFAIRLYQPGTIDTIFRNTLTGAVSFAYTDSISGTREVRVQQHSSLRSLAVPLMVGRAWAQGGWQLAVQTGADLQLSYWKKGSYLSEGYQLRDAPSDRRLGLAFRLEGQVLLPPLRFGQPFVRGTYRRFLHQPVGLSPGTAFRPESVGFTVGWRVRL